MNSRSICTTAGRLVLAALIWQASVTLLGIPDYLLPSPVQVAVRFADASSVFLLAMARTTAEGLSGLAVAIALTTVLGIGFALSSVVERNLNGYLVALQSIPILSVAPLLTIWFGPGFWSKAAASTLVCFFPLAAGWSAGIRSVPLEERELFRTLGASRLQTARWLVIPRTMPFLFAGLRVAAPLSILGSIVGEFVGATGGLGFLILSSSYYARTADMFVCIALSAFVSLVLYYLTVSLERRIVFWQGAISRGNPSP